jgi:YVTN family beta-propeller protein
MLRAAFLAGAALFALAGCARPEAALADVLVLERTIPLAGVEGRIDHLAVDLKRSRLYVAALGNGTVEAVDLSAGKVIARIPGLEEPQGIAYLPNTDEVAVATGGDGKVRFYKGADLSPLAELDGGPDADNLRVTDAGGLVVGSDSLKTIDPHSHAVVRSVPLPAHAEGFRLDGDRFFVNLPRAGRIAAGDLKTGVAASWANRYGMNYPMAIDPASGRIAVVYRLPARLLVLDAGSGAVLSDRATCGDSDDVFFDPKRKRLYVSCGGGSIDVFEAEGADKPLARIDTRAGARTSFYSPELDRLFVAARAGAGREAAILVYRPAS